MTKTQAEQLYNLTHSPQWKALEHVIDEKIFEIYGECEWCSPETLGQKQGYIAGLRYVLSLGAKAEDLLGD